MKPDKSEADFLAQFRTQNDAIAFEDQALSIGDQFLPAFARAVRDGDAGYIPAPEYWDWLCAQLSAE